MPPILHQHLDQTLALATQSEAEPSPGTAPATKSAAETSPSACHANCIRNFTAPSSKFALVSTKHPSSPAFATKYYPNFSFLDKNTRLPQNLKRSLCHMILALVCRSKALQNAAIPGKYTLFRHDISKRMMKAKFTIEMHFDNALKDSKHWPHGGAL